MQMSEVLKNFILLMHFKIGKPAHFNGCKDQMPEKDSFHSFLFEPLRRLFCLMFFSPSQ